MTYAQFQLHYTMTSMEVFLLAMSTQARLPLAVFMTKRILHRPYIISTMTVNILDLQNNTYKVTCEGLQSRRSVA